MQLDKVYEPGRFEPQLGQLLDRWVVLDKQDLGVHTRIMPGLGASSARGQ